MKFVSLIICTLILKAGTAQFSMPFSIGSVGGGSFSSTTFSGSVSITGKACVVVANGVSTLREETTQQEYVNACPERMIVDSVTKLSFLLFPNPVSDIVTLKPTKQLNINEEFFVYVFAPSGVCVKKIKTTYADLKLGFKIRMLGLPQGVYYVSIQSAKQSVQLPLIKVGQ